MIDLKLDPITRDLIIPIQPIDGAERIARAVGIKLRRWLGDWFLDTSSGVPYLENVLIKNPKPAIVEALLRAQILQVEGVRTIKTFNLNIDPRTRKATASFSAETVDGFITLSVGVERP